MPVVETLGGKQVVVVDAVGGSAYLGLPSTEELYRRYHQFRTILFDSKVPPVDHPNLTIEWSNRLKGPAGVCWVTNPTYTKDGVRGTEWRIALSTKYHAKFPEQIWDTLAHEMIHIVDDVDKRLRKAHKGPQWTYWMNKINSMSYTVEGMRSPISITVHADEKADTEIKWEYTCQNDQCDYTKRTIRRRRASYGMVLICPKCRTPVKERSLKKFRERG